MEAWKKIRKRESQSYTSVNEDAECDRESKSRILTTISELVKKFIYFLRISSAVYTEFIFHKLPILSLHKFSACRFLAAFSSRQKKGRAAKKFPSYFGVFKMAERNFEFIIAEELVVKNGVV